MTKRSAIAISATVVVALMAGVVGANRATLGSTAVRPVVVVQRTAPVSHVLLATPDRE
jgi:hypothetical protein